MVLVESVVLLVSFLLLIKGSDFFVESASDLAEQFGISSFVIGLTAVAIGTSVPELASSVAATLKGATGIVVGNVVGSNIANIGLIVGLTALFGVIKTDSAMLRRDGYLLLFAGSLLFLFMLGGVIGWLEAFVMLALYATYLVFLLEEESRDPKEQRHIVDYFNYVVRFRYLRILTRGNSRNKPTKSLHQRTIIRDLAVMAFSVAAIVVGAKYLIEQAIYFAHLFNVPEAVIGVTLIALGTSLPELSVSISAVRKGMGDIAIGNIIGSNIANSLLIIGVAGLITPINVSYGMILFSAPFMLGMSALLLLFIRSGWNLSRREGIALLLCYAAFLTITIMKPGLA